MSKRRQLQRESGVAYRGLFLGGLSKIGELLINSSFSLEKAYISYFAVTGVSKQALLFALIIFFSRVGQMLFSRVFFNTIQSHLPKGQSEVSVLERCPF